ncbi:MAG: hypothetical protein LBM63_01740 [Rikenellaceae bacterium]|jgi:hypothetical protein|nr:hypothetical protein [Rikenellaceae bacterium]
MKTTRFLVTLALVASTLAFTFCDDPYEDPYYVVEHPTPEPPEENISSMFAGKQMLSIVYVTTEGLTTHFDYTSWMYVHHETAPATRGYRIDTITVALRNSLSDVKDTQYVDEFFYEGEPSVDISTEYVGESISKEDRRVIIYDSVKLVTYRQGVAVIEYRLPFQTAVYDDGMLREEFPGRKYGNKYNPINVVPDSFTVFPNGMLTKDGKTYIRNTVKHAIIVEFEYERYRVRATVDLLVEVADTTSPYVVEEKLVGESIVDGESSYQSILSLQKLWSTGETTDDDYVATINSGQYDDVNHDLRTEEYTFDDVTYYSTFVNDPVYLPAKNVDGFITKSTFTQDVVFQFFDMNLKESMSVKIVLWSQSAEYYDGFYRIPFPGHKFHAENIEPISSRRFSHYQDGRPVYHFSLRIKAYLGTSLVEGFYEGDFKLLD